MGKKNERFETKQEEIRHRQYLVGTYYAQGKGNDEIIDLLRQKHSLHISRATIGRDIYLIRRRNVEELKKDLESFKAEAFWALKLREIAEERRRLWEIAQSPQSQTGTAVSALRQIQALRGEEIAVYERLGALSAGVQQEVSRLIIGHPMPGDRVVFEENGSFTIKK